MSCLEKHKRAQGTWERSASLGMNAARTLLRVFAIWAVLSLPSSDSYVTIIT